MPLSYFKLLQDETRMITYQNCVYKVKLTYELLPDSNIKLSQKDAHEEIEDVIRAVLYLRERNRQLPQINTQTFVITPVVKFWKLTKKIGFKQNGYRLKSSHTLDFKISIRKDFLLPDKNKDKFVSSLKSSEQLCSFKHAYTINKSERKSSKNELSTSCKQTSDSSDPDPSLDIISKTGKHVDLGKKVENVGKPLLKSDGSEISEESQMKSLRTNNCVNNKKTNPQEKTVKNEYEIQSTSTENTTTTENIKELHDNYQSLKNKKQNSESLSAFVFGYNHWKEKQRDKMAFKEKESVDSCYEQNKDFNSSNSSKRDAESERLNNLRSISSPSWQQQGKLKKHDRHCVEQEELQEDMKLQQLAKCSPSNRSRKRDSTFIDLIDGYFLSPAKKLFTYKN